MPKKVLKLDGLTRLNDNELVIPWPIEHLFHQGCRSFNLFIPQPESQGRAPRIIAVTLQFVLAGIDQRQALVIVEHEADYPLGIFCATARHHPFVLGKGTIAYLNPALGQVICPGFGPGLLPLR